MDLLDWHRGRLSSRRLAVLVKHMPRDSAVAQELHGDGAEWTVTDYLLAAAVDHLAAANWMFASVNTDEDSEPPERPVPVPRPGDHAEPEEPPAGEPIPPEVPDRAELMRFFA
ncbi:MULTISPECIES: hypothetical protein [Streptomyces]|uniref:Uncharacterized protein n=1 Tax=Streptomyces glycanivorans TaxID=3033808 RepID=A0ABY9JQL2_9ACTN|nr:MULTISPECIES: hypothetical protein [unclassified Streptomyces]WSQ82314.1 hypothetical protein OG725_13780 [Streptomyces sp. NBC_01213]TXS19020.1 hypothetical protein EAO68_07195 [Streptomyces sp. wa22]WLQ68938.1 hypothetical protein P8A20_14500 [Streptomyces sp. Alt3]WSQ89638.1 hypothetical protein OG722_14450 [Streptomyces sp. NBC_01212]WSR11378.1 hypothetical protein OG265_21565 [Streptomyces sp. NBC_01208]